VPTTDVTVADPKDHYLVAVAISSAANVLISDDDDIVVAAADLHLEGWRSAAPFRFVEKLGQG